MSVQEIFERRLTPEEYLEWEENQTERHEYIDGVIIAMSGGTYAHNQIVGDVAQEIGVRLLGTPCRKFTSSQRVGARNARAYFYPDVGIHCGEPELGKGDTLLNPVALFEVLSPSTERFDRHERFRHYQRIESLREYFLVHQDRALVEAFRKTEQGGWQSLLYSAYMGLESSFEIESAGITLPLSGIYHGVTLEEPESPAP